MSPFQSLACKIRTIMSYYAVAIGRSPGVYMTWNECKSQVNRYPGAAYKKFSSMSEANIFITERGSPSKSSRNNSGKKSTPYSLLNKSSYIERKESNTKTIKSYFSNDQPSNFCSYSSVSTSGQDFQKDSDGRVDIYTDGACTSNGCKNAKAGLGVYFGDNHPANVSKPVRGRATNNNAEIQAVTEAAKIARQNGLSKIRINTDSEFLINCKTKWMKGWKARGWRTAKNQPVINKVELEEMERALAPLDVEFNHVRGHVGIHGNEMADQLARVGANMN